jgi:hypothetical protein
MGSRRTPARCACGCTYDEFRLGMTFADARRMLWDQPDPNRPGWYRQKRRRSVLGLMRELKLHYWSCVHGQCDEARAA